MTYLDAVILGIIQALTEFLPVSSSGHLVLGQALFGIEAVHGIAFEVMVHFGTLFSVLYCYRRELYELVASLIPKAAKNRDGGWSEVGLLFIGCLPAGFVGIAFKTHLESAFDSPSLVAYALMGTGVVLLSTRSSVDKKRPLTTSVALLIGCAQAVAIIPGVSRAGMTIAVAMWLGVTNAKAAKFSFFLSIPVIFGASLLQLKTLAEQGVSSETWSLLVVAAFVAFFCGVLALKLLLVLLDRGLFSRFGWYCLSVGGFALLML